MKRSRTHLDKTAVIVAVIGAGATIICGLFTLIGGIVAILLTVIFK